MDYFFTEDVLERCRRLSSIGVGMFCDCLKTVLQSRVSCASSLTVMVGIGLGDDYRKDSEKI